MGGSTVEAIVGNKIAPRLLDHYLGKTGYESQQTSEPEDPKRPDNLWDPVDSDRDFGSHGSFDAKANRSSFELWSDLHRSKIGLGIGLSAIALGFFLRSRRKTGLRSLRHALLAD